MPHDHNAILKALGKIELVNHHQPLWKKKNNLPLSNLLNPPFPSGGIFHELSISGRGGSLTWPGGKKPVRASIYSLAQVFWFHLPRKTVGETRNLSQKTGCSCRLGGKQLAHSNTVQVLESSEILLFYSSQIQWAKPTDLEMVFWCFNDI